MLFALQVFVLSGPYQPNASSTAPVCQIGLPASCAQDGRRVFCPTSVLAGKLAANTSKGKPLVTATGYWETASDYVYYMDQHLVRELAKLFLDSNLGGDVIEFGAGRGCYVLALQTRGIQMRGFDGMPHLIQQTGGLVRTLDLSKPTTSLHSSAWVLQNK